ncbi:MAG: hypothetical protein RQ824_11110 [bacterium]|nr:hypothetical protein [bacterium]
MIKKLMIVAFVLCWNPSSLPAFTFDNWRSGMPLEEVFDLSEKIDLPIRRDGLVSENKHFDPETSRAHADKANIFYYKTRLFNAPARVMLGFTGESRLLYEVRVRWQGVNVKKELAPAVEDMLQKKYGDPAKRGKFFSKDKAWHLDQNNRLLIEYSGAALQLVYIDLLLEKAGLDEKKKAEKQKKDEGLKRDLNKF